LFDFEISTDIRVLRAQGEHGECGITYVGVPERVETVYTREGEMNVREMEERGKPEERD
jgi:hypothetical protein